MISDHSASNRVNILPNASLHVQRLCRIIVTATDFPENSTATGTLYGDKPICGFLIVLGFNDTSTLVGHFVSSHREREKRDRIDSRGNEREGQGRKIKRNESEEIEEIKTSPPPPLPLPATWIAGLAHL